MKINRDGYRIISSTDPRYPKGTYCDVSKIMYEADKGGYTIELILQH